jgi:phage replication initiation protein
MGKLKETSSRKLQDLKIKNDIQEILGFIEVKDDAAAQESVELVPDLGRARVKKTRLPHQKHGVDCPPFNNMGETSGLCPEKSHDIAMMRNVELVMSDGQVKIIPTRIPTENHCAVIDWVNLTVHQDTFLKTSGRVLFDTLDYVFEASRICEQLFGFGVTADNAKIMNFYKNSWVLGDNFGYVCHGGQADTLMIVLNGTGCINAIQGWEKRLHHFLTQVSIRPQITRIDLAHDDFEAAHVTPDWAEQQWIEGNMSLSANAPNIEKRGNWHRPNGRGRTLYIGCRKSGKFSRIYERGRKEGDKESLWTRFEIELKSSDRLVPLDIFLNPSAYFLGAYPCLVFLKNQLITPQRIKVKQQTAKISLERSIEIVKTQVGRYVTFLRKFFNNDELFLSKISHSDPNAIPKRLELPLRGLNTSTTFLHDNPHLQLTPEAVLAMPLDALKWVIENGKPTLKGGQWDLAY